MRYDLRPFPALWKAFEDDTEVRDRLNRGLPFETLTEASRVLAIQGAFYARQYLVGEAKPSGPVASEIDREALFRSHDEAMAK